MPFSIRPYRRFPVQCLVTYNARPYLKLLLAYFLSFGSLMTLLVLSGGLAYAEWVEVIRNERKEITVYVDPDTVRRKAAMVTMWVLSDFKTTRAIAGRMILSIKGEEEYDCDGQRSRVLTFSEFSGNMGSGKELYSTSHESPWLPVASEKVVQTLWSFACGKQ